MRRIFVSNGADAADPMSGGGNAAGLANGLSRIGLAPTSVRLPKSKARPIQVAAAAARCGLLGRSMRDVYFMPEGQQALWPYALPKQAALIDFFQVSPLDHLKRSDLTIFRYIDMTLQQFFQYGSYAHLKLNKRIWTAERRSYERADAVFCCTEWARRSVIDDYGIPPAKVTVSRSGANLDFDLVERLQASPPRVTLPAELRLVFIGVDWRRKGLAKLAGAVDILRERGLPASIVALGPEPEQIRHLTCVEAWGLFDKAGRMAEFVEVMTSSAFGALWSTAEGLPNSLMEALALGVPVLTSDIPPIRSGLSEATGIMLDVDAEPEVIATALEAVWTDPARYITMREQAQTQAMRFTWLPSARRIAQLIAESSPVAPRRAGLSRAEVALRP